MGLADKARDAAARAKTLAAGHRGEVAKAVEKAEALADRQTQGKYTDQIHKAGAKADAYVETLQTPAPPQDDAPAPPMRGSDAPERPGSA